MHHNKISVKERILKVLFTVFVGLFFTGSDLIYSDALTFPAKKWGICFGNSANFSGLRINFTDNGVETINGINFTFWKPRDEKATGTVNGMSLGVMPYAARLNGIQLGIVGAGAKEDIHGITVGLIGAGCGGDMVGINIGGIGLGSGGDLTGINIGLVGAGAGGSVTGINFGGLGIGAGEDLFGINAGLLGVGAGRDVKGINISGIGVGAGNSLQGMTISGVGAGAPTVQGLTIAGGAVGGQTVEGVAIALGTVRIVKNGTFTGLAISAFNHIKGTQRGVAIGIVNYAYRLKGVQIGLINIVRDNPKGRIALPLINFNF